MSTIWTEDDITQLKAHVASGVLTVSYSGPPARTVTYQSLDAMRKLLAEMVAAVRTEDGTRPTYRLAGFRKGFDE